MNNDDRVNDPSANPTPNAPPLNTTGKPVDVVERDREDPDDDTRAVDEVITPTSTRIMEQDTEELKRKTDEIERKVADGN